MEISGFVLVSFVGGQTVGGIPLMIVMFYKMILSNGTIQPNPENFAELSAFGIGSNMGLFLMLIPFVVSLIVLLLLYKPLHRKNFKTIITGSESIRWKRFIVGAGIWFLISVIYLVSDYFINQENYVLNFDASSFITLVLISLIIIPLQSSYEEIMFRGYLAQGVAAKSKSRWMAIFIPSLLFGLLHLMNPEVGTYGFWVMFPQYFLFGFVFGLITVLDNGTELAMGAHSANNIFLSVFVTSKSSVLQTSALLVQQTVYPVKELIMLMVFFIVFLSIVAFIYKWDFKILNKKIKLEDKELSISQ